MLRTITILLATVLLAPSLCLGENRFFFGPALALTGSGDHPRPYWPYWAGAAVLAAIAVAAL